jgi:DNA topoisomerase I
MKHSRSTPAAKRGKRRARKVGLVYVNQFDHGITRRACGNGFVYLSPRGKIIKSMRTRQRIEALAIPPAWQGIWICPQTNGHIQARGRDEAGRSQYIYHDKWQTISAATKFDRMHLMAELLPRIRRKVRSDLKGKKLTRQRVLAAVVRLLDRAHLRVGNDRYAQQNGSRGATTLTTDHVDVERFTISLDFPGKSGQQHEIEFTDEKTAKVIRQCEEIDNQFLFCYRDVDGEARRIDSTDVNDYLRTITGEPLSSKDFRTWWGSVLALGELSSADEDLTPAKRKKAARAAVAAAADALGNTKAICRKSYIHPGLLAAAESGELPALLKKAKRTEKPSSELTVHEALFANLLPHLDFS